MRKNDMNESGKRAIRSSKFSFLVRELESWKEAKLVTQEQASDIKNYYEVTYHYFSKSLVNLGMALIGAAILSYIAANWMEFSRVFKIVLILSAYICSVFFAWFLEKRSPIISRSLLLLGSFIYGGGIFLIAQIFHEGGHYTDALLYWMIGITPACLLFKDRFQLNLIQLISIVYLSGLFFDVYSYLYYGNVDAILAVLGVFRAQIALVAGLWLLWLYTRGRICFNLNIFVSLYFVSLILHVFSVGENDLVVILFCLGALFSLIPSSKYKDLNIWGVLLIGVCGLIMTNSYFWSWTYRGYGGSASLKLIYSISPSLMNILTPDVLSVSSGVLTCTLLVFFMLKDSVLAFFFFCAVIIRYFFDSFYDFLPKSLMFAVSGIVLIAVGILVGKLYKNKKNKNIKNTSEEAMS